MLVDFLLGVKMYLKKRFSIVEKRFFVDSIQRE
jgi:hypothetical protein